MKHIELHDKLAVFKAAGQDTSSGWDYAIPQPWADSLSKMGIDNPGRWFVADCSGACAFPVLRHVGEAVYTILEHRSKANEEIMMQFYTSSLAPEASVGDKLMYQFLMDYAGNEICNDADCGFLDLNIVSAAWADGFSQGRRSMSR